MMTDLSGGKVSILLLQTYCNIDSFSMLLNATWNDIIFIFNTLFALLINFKKLRGLVKNYLPVVAKIKKDRRCILCTS